MNDSHIEKIRQDFSDSEFDLVVAALETVELKHVMANSQMNLDNTRSAILHLSKGNFEDLKAYVEDAKRDFRDVIYWATLEGKNDK